MFKKGDKVKIKKLEPNKEYGGLWFDEEMREFADNEEVHTVEIVEEYKCGDPIYFLEDIELFIFNNGMLERVS